MSTYTVRSGDTLSALARRHGTTVQALARVNNISNPNFIRTGQRLTIPGRSDSYKPPTSTRGSRSASTYTIRSGDTLSGIAARHGTTVSALARANGISNPNLIIAGRTLKIPGSGGGGGNAAPAPAGTPSSANAKMQRLADVARRNAQNVNTRGWCAREVNDAMQMAGLRVDRRPSAYMYADMLARDSRFREVRLSDDQIRKLPPGAIVVSVSGRSTRHGHIAVTLGNNQEASDHVATLSLHGTQRVFLPV